MAGRWYFRLGSSAHGPVTLEFLITRIQAGQITADHLVRDGEAEPWEAAGQTAELRAYFTNNAPAPPASPPPANPPSASPPPARRAVPVAEPEPLAIAPVIAPIAARPKPGGRSGNIAPARRTPNSSTPRGLMIGIAIGGVAVLLVGMIVVVNLVGSSGSPTASTAGNKQEPVEVSETASAKASKPGALSETDRAAAIESVSTWREAGRTKAGLKDIFSFTVERVVWDPASPPRCRVHLRVTNTSAGELDYPSWNAVGETNAWLAKPDNTFLALASGNAKAQRLAAGQAIEEVLEFAVAKPSQGDLRLVLPYAVVERDGYAGYRLDADLWREKTSSPMASTLAATAPPVSAPKKPAASKPVDEKQVAAKKPEPKKPDPKKDDKKQGKKGTPVITDPIPSRDSLQGQIMEAGVPEE